MPAPSNEGQALDRERPALPAQEADLEARLSLRANRADQAGLVVQDIARSALRKLIQRACIQCHRVITAATLKLLDTKYKVACMILKKCQGLLVSDRFTQG